MKAMAIPGFGEPLEMVDLPDPVAGPDEVVLSVRGCGVCRTDLKIVKGEIPSVRRATMPLVPGHEIAGVVETIGTSVEGWQVGDRVITSHFVGCGHCATCRTGRAGSCANLRSTIGFNTNGGYAEKVRVPARNLVRVGPGVSDAQAAIIPDALATAVHAVVDRAQVRLGDRVLVVGAGGLGIHAVQMAHLSGAYTMVADIDEAKLSVARELGADETYLVTDVGSLPLSIRANKVIEMSGTLMALKDIAGAMDRPGVLVVVGYTAGASIEVPFMDLIGGEFDIRGCKASNMDNLMTAAELVEMGKLHAVVDSTFPLAEANEVLSRLSAGQLTGRAVLVPDLT